MDGVLAVIEAWSSIELSGRHPQLAAVIDPHSIHPRKAGIGNQGRYLAGGRNLQNSRTIGVADVDCPSGVNRSAASRGRIRELLDMSGQRRFVEGRIVKEARLDPGHRP